MFEKKDNLAFLHPMNEVNIKHLICGDFQIFSYRFSGRIRTFYRRKTDFYEISVAVPSAVCYSNKENVIKKSQNVKHPHTMHPSFSGPYNMMK
jgi:hypothetical protein